jgi:hypothetical protein
LRAWRGSTSLSSRLVSFISNCTADRLNAGRPIIPWSYRLRPTGLQAIC